MISQRLLMCVKTVMIYEDFNENYLEIVERCQGLHSDRNPDRVRETTPAVGAAFANKSRQLEHLSVAFLADAWIIRCLPSSLAMVSTVFPHIDLPGDVQDQSTPV